MAQDETHDDDTVVNDYIPIATRPLPTEILFPDGPDRSPDCVMLLEHLKREGRLHTVDLMALIERTNSLMLREPNVIRIQDPVTIVGDLHGQFYDLVGIFDMVGVSPSERTFLFLGDYVDRGVFSVEILTYLFALKVAYPSNIVLLRGNHESAQMSHFFNFRDECLYKYSESVFLSFINVFNAMPLSAIVNNQYLCLHGGISPDLHSVSQLFTIDRFCEPPIEGLFCDLLWADPLSHPKSADSSPLTKDLFLPNDTRGCSYFYSHEAACAFLASAGLSCIIRAHEVQIDGFKMAPINPATQLPSTITVFSAPNYCDLYGNKGAVLNIVNDIIDVVQFTAAPHPYSLPSFMNVFQWSVPFVAEKVSEILHSIMHVPEEPPTASGPSTPSSRMAQTCESMNTSELIQQLQDRIEEKSHAVKNLTRFRAKAKSVARMMFLMKKVRDNRDSSAADVHKVRVLAASVCSDDGDDKEVGDERFARRRSSFNEISVADLETERKRPYMLTSPP